MFGWMMWRWAKRLPSTTNYYSEHFSFGPALRCSRAGAKSKRSEQQLEYILSLVSS